MNILWTQEETDYLIENYGVLDFDILKKYFHYRNSTSVIGKIRSLKLKLPKKTQENKLLDNSLTTFYYIGLLLADGYFCQVNNYYVMGIELKQEDAEYLKKFADYIKTPMFTRMRKTNFSNNYYSISTKATGKVVNDIMKKFDIHFRKSHNPPDFFTYDFSDEQLMSLFIGFIDGDGSISNYKTKNKISIQISKEWVNNLSYMNDFIHRMFFYDNKTTVVINSRNHACLYLTKTRMIQDLKDFSISNNLPILDRKWKNVLDRSIKNRRSFD